MASFCLAERVTWEISLPYISISVKNNSLGTHKSILIQKLLKGFVEFIYDLGSGVTSVRSKYPLSLDEWHAIKISRTARLAVMKVDAQPEVMTVSPNGFWHLSLPFSLYLGEHFPRRVFLYDWITNNSIFPGGISKLNLLPSNLRDRGFFIGCVKQVRLIWNYLKTWFSFSSHSQFEVNDRNIELIEDALGGFNIDNCNDTCMLDNKLPVLLNKTVEAWKGTNEGDGEIADGHKTNNKKYAFDVVDDSSDNQIDSVHSKENWENGSASYDESMHKRIVRVSLQKPLRLNQGACFRGNESYALYDSQKLIKPTERYENNINIRFKTLAPNGLMFMIYQKLPNQHGSYVSLSVEDGWVSV